MRRRALEKRNLLVLAVKFSMFKFKYENRRMHSEYYSEQLMWIAAALMISCTYFSISTFNEFI